MSLRDAAKSDLVLYGKLKLAARGVARTRESLAGAMLEAEVDLNIVGFIQGYASASKKK